MENLTATELKVLNNVTDILNKDVNLGTKLQSLIDTLVVSGTPVNAVVATGLLTLTSVVIHNEKVIIGDDLYEFLATTAQTPSAPGNIPVSIVASTVKAHRALTVDTRPTSGDTMTIGTKVYTFVPVGTDTADGEVSIGADLAGAQANIVAAINGTDEFNIAHTLVTAGVFDQGDDSEITALIGGTIGNTIATTETFTAETNVFAGVTLASGANCSAANAITALISKVTSHGTESVSAAPGQGTTVVFTADVAGVLGEGIMTSTQMVNGSFGHAHLTGGVDGTVGAKNIMLVDASYLYVAIDTNTISGTNWRRITLGTVY